MRYFLLILSFSIASNKMFGSNPFWMLSDKKLIHSIVVLDKNNPKQVEAYFKKQNNEKPNAEYLGFGWKVWRTAIGGGYISISAAFHYYNDSLVSYTLAPRLPDETRLLSRYKKWYGNHFNYSNEQIQAYHFNQTGIFRPLKQYPGTPGLISDEIANYMSPNSGTMYGYSGGMGSILANREAFQKIKGALTDDQVLLLLYSINPASRFTAIEYYWKHKDRFENTFVIDEWIEQNFKEIPVVKSMLGCFRETFETRDLIYMYTLMGEKNQ